MNQIRYIALLLLVAGMLNACNNNKPKPISKNITKTTVLVNGKKDSVINNPQKNYGTATISDPCAKMLFQNIQATDSFKKLTAGKPAASITYVLSWVKASVPMIRSNGGKITNGIEVIVNEKTGNAKHKLGSYVYNNEDAKMYYINNNNKYDEMEEIDAAGLKRIRNGCYWGVASHQ